MGNSNTRERQFHPKHSNFGEIARQCIQPRRSSLNDLRPWSRTSRRCWSSSTLNDPFNVSKTAWPVPRFEAMFLPEFSVKEDYLKTNFIFIDFIANGAYGKVFKVLKKETKEVYALKILSKAKVVIENAVSQAKQEVFIQRLVGHHIFILGLSNYWQERKTLNIITEYVAGGELLDLIKEYGCLPENIVRIYIAEVASAIGVIHRDIKASNILLDIEGHVKLIDFGLAKCLRLMQRTGTFCGTFEYMAPEVVKKQYYGHEVDWWALGVLACFLFTNQYPSHITLETLNDTDIIIGKLPEQTTHLSEPAIDLLQRLLHPEPRLRLKSILSLQRIAFYMGYNISNFSSKEVSPFRLLNKKIKEPDFLPANSNLHEIYSFIENPTWNSR